MPSTKRIATLSGICASLVVGCRQDPEPTTESSRQARVGAQQRRTAGDAAGSNLDILATELAAARACDRLRDQFRALPAGDGSTAIGTLWIRDCVGTANGQNVTFAVGGDAWRVLRGARAGSAPERFGFSLTVSGRLGVTYDTAARVLTARFEPTQPPTFFVIPRNQAIRDSRMDSAIASALATALSAPNQAPAVADADPRYGVTVVIPVCNPVPVFTFESVPAVPAGAVDPGTPVVLAGDTVALFGPQSATGGLELSVQATEGAVHAAVVCHDDARRIAATFLAGKPWRPKPLVETTTTRTARLQVPEIECPVTLVVRPARGAEAVFRWYQPVVENVPAVESGPLRCAPVEPEPQLSTPR